jgi:pilus assembly protein CpaB
MREGVAELVGMPPGVAGFVRPQDRVSILATVTPSEQPTRTQYLVQNVEVLAVGRSAATGDGDTVIDGGERVLLTLALTADEVEKVALALAEGELYFTLVPAGQPDQGTTGRTVDDLFS